MSAKRDSHFVPFLLPSPATRQLSEAEAILSRVRNANGSQVEFAPRARKSRASRKSTHRGHHGHGGHGHHHHHHHKHGHRSRSHGPGHERGGAPRHARFEEQVVVPLVPAAFPGGRGGGAADTSETGGSSPSPPRGAGSFSDRERGYSTSPGGVPHSRSSRRSGILERSRSFAALVEAESEAGSASESESTIGTQSSGSPLAGSRSASREQGGSRGQHRSNRRVSQAVAQTMCAFLTYPLSWHPPQTCRSQCTRITRS